VKRSTRARQAARSAPRRTRIYSITADGPTARPAPWRSGRASRLAWPRCSGQRCSCWRGVPLACKRLSATPWWSTRWRRLDTARTARLRPLTSPWRHLTIAPRSHAPPLAPHLARLAPPRSRLLSRAAMRQPGMSIWRPARRPAGAASHRRPAPPPAPTTAPRELDDHGSTGTGRHQARRPATRARAPTRRARPATPLSSAAGTASSTRARSATWAWSRTAIPAPARSSARRPNVAMACCRSAKRRAITARAITILLTAGACKTANWGPGAMMARSRTKRSATSATTTAAASSRRTGSRAMTAAATRRASCFLSSIAYKGGEIGGVEGAHTKCKILAEKAGYDNSANFMAWLSDAVHSPADDFLHTAGPALRAPRWRAHRRRLGRPGQERPARRDLCDRDTEQ
jgi:hypothetical protein